MQDCRVRSDPVTNKKSRLKPVACEDGGGELAERLEMFVLVELLLEGKDNVSSMFPSLITGITKTESFQRETQQSWKSQPCELKWRNPCAPCNAS